MLVFDRNRFGTKREIDPNGYLRVSACNITKTQVRIYYGKEIPGWKDFNLDPDKIYNVYCPAEELKKALETFNNLPLTREHIEVNVNNVPKDKIVGSLGDSAQFKSPYVQNSIIVYDQKDIDWIMSGRKRELSCGYTYTPVQQSGEFNGLPYDFIMTEIVGNHVALVKEGRAGHDVMVADENIVYDYNKNHDSDGRFGFGKIVVSGDELGGKELSLKELREKAQEYYKDNLAGESENNKNLGDVFFSLRGYKHPIAFSTRKEKLLLFPHLRKLIKSGVVSGPFEDIHGNDKNKWYRITNTVEMHDLEGGQTDKNVVIHVRQDANGKLYYDHTIKIPADDSIRLKMNGLNSRSAEENKLTSDEDIISQGYDVVNIFFADEEELPNFTENENNNKLLDKGEESMVNDEFKEADHPRDKDGKFKSAGSGSSSSLKDDKDVDNYWQSTGSKESQESGNVKVMQKQLEDLKKMHKEILGKPGFVSLEDQERAKYIEKDMKELEKEIAKKESEGKEKGDLFQKQLSSLKDSLKSQLSKEITSNPEKLRELAKNDDQLTKLAEVTNMGQGHLKNALNEMADELGGSEKKDESSKETAVEKMYKKLSEQGMKGEALEQAIYEKHGWEGVEEARMISEYESGNPKHSQKEQEELVKSLEEELGDYKKIVKNFEDQGETGIDYNHYKQMVERQEGALKKAKSQLDWINRHTKKEMAHDEIPEKAGKPEKAGEEEALNKGEEKVANEVKEAIAEKKEEVKEELAEDACGKGKDAKGAKDEGIDKRKLIDEIGGILKGKLEEELWRTVMKKAEELAYNDSERSADDKKPAKDEDKKDLKGKEEKAFAEGVDFGEKKEKEEPKKLDSEHEAEGLKKAEEKKEAKDKCTMDSQIVMDIDAIKAQVREEVMADFKARETARKAVRSIVGDVNVMTFDSAEEIYKFACEKAGMDLNEIVSFKDAFRGLSAAKGMKLALDASPVSGSNEECLNLKNIRIA